MLKLFKNFQKQEWLLAVVSIALIVTQVWLDLTMPDYMYEITTLVQTEGSDTPSSLPPFFPFFPPSLCV